MAVISMHLPIIEIEDIDTSQLFETPIDVLCDYWSYSGKRWKEK